MKIAIVVGHNDTGKGAYAPENLVKNKESKSEFDFHNLIADEMVRRSKGMFSNLTLKRFNRPYHGSKKYSSEIREVYGKVDAWGADASMELHFNWASKPYVSGALCLSSGSKKSLEFATVVQKHMERVMGLGTFPPGVEVRRSGNGAGALKAGDAPAILTEPFFCTNPEAVKKVQSLGLKGFADMYYKAILEYAKIPDVTRDESVVDVATPTRRNLFGANQLKTEGLTKNEFFTNNYAVLTGAVDTLNDFLKIDTLGEDDHNTVSMLDVFAVMNAEIGMNGSLVDPKFVHSEDEVGLMPLPDNLQFWNGNEAPETDHHLSTEENVSEFLTYLGALKNKKIGRSHSGVPFYCGLFGPEVDEPGQMHLLAAVVHGWFTPYTYPSGANPDFLAIAEKTRAAHLDPEGPLALLKQYEYVNAVRTEGSVVVNRINNLNAIVSAPPQVPSAVA